MSNTTFETMPVSQLRPHPKNVRHDLGDLKELADSIKEQGLLQPLVVAPHPTLEGDYVMVAGHRRHAAARKAGLTEVPVVIRHDLNSDGTIIAAMLVENLQRTDLSAVEEAEGYQALLDFGDWTPAKVAKSTGTSAKRVKDRLPLAKLPAEQKKQLVQQQIPLTNASRLADFVDSPKLYAELLPLVEFSTEYFESRAKGLDAVLRFERSERPRLAEMIGAGWPTMFVPEQHFEALYESNQAAEDELLHPAGSTRAIKAVKEQWPEARLVVTGAASIEQVENPDQVFWYVAPEDEAPDKILLLEDSDTEADDRPPRPAVDNPPWLEKQERYYQQRAQWASRVDEILGSDSLDGVNFALRKVLAGLDVSGLMPPLFESVLSLAGFQNQLLHHPESTREKFKTAGMWSEAIEARLESEEGPRFGFILLWLYGISEATGSTDFWMGIVPPAWAQDNQDQLARIQRWFNIRDQLLGFPATEVEQELLNAAIDFFTPAEEESSDE